MEKNSFGSMISSLRREKGLTQSELAEKMGVTDKAVSKWERDLSFPDISSLPKLAEIFGLSVDELIQAKARPSAEKNTSGREAGGGIPAVILKGVSLAMGVAAAVLSVMGRLEAGDAVKMLAIGLACLSAAALSGQRI